MVLVRARACVHIYIGVPALYRDDPAGNCQKGKRFVKRGEIANFIFLVFRDKNVLLFDISLLLFDKKYMKFDIFFICRGLFSGVPLQ